jgi:hypothetical protein
MGPTCHEPPGIELRVWPTLPDTPAFLPGAEHARCRRTTLSKTPQNPSMTESVRGRRPDSSKRLVGAAVG